MVIDERYLILQYLIIERLEPPFKDIMIPASFQVRFSLKVS